MANLLSERRLLITSGPTRASLDAVRFISNRSSGRLGCRIATEALARGAQVTLVAGPQSVVPRQEDISAAEWQRLKILHIETVFELLQMLQVELASSPPYDAVVHAMAVLDYVPDESSDQKVPSGKEAWTVRLVKTPKVIERIKVWAPDALLVGFKLEVNESEERLRQIALDSLRKYRADFVVANNLAQIRDEAHPALIIGADGTVLARPRTKGEIAHELCGILAEALSR